MRLRDEFLLRQIGERFFLLPVGQAVEEGRELVELNRTGYDILNCLLEETTMEKLVKDISIKYEATAEEMDTVRKSVSDYVTKLLDFNFLII